MPRSSEEIALIEQIAKLDGLRELLEDDIAEDDPSNFVNVQDNHPPFKQLYLDARVAFRKYKDKYVPASVTEEQFNAPDSVHTFNDTWMLGIKKTFQAVNKSVVTFLHTTATAASNPEPQEEKLKVAGKAEYDRLVTKIHSECKQLTGALDDCYTLLQSVTHINPNQSQIHTSHQQNLLTVLDDKIPALLASLSLAAGPGDSDQVKQANSDYAVLEAKEKPRLYRLVHLIAEKTQFVPAASSSNSTTSRPAKSESVHLKKVDPPKFSGDEVEFPEFHRKWLAIVSPANLPDEAEVDRLRDALPKDAREMLEGVHKREKAWDILTKRFGDKDLIATTLKNQLKSLCIKERTDHEKMITLAVKIRSIVTRLESLGASEALKHDGEFISAIYFQLPDRQKSKWLEFDKASYSDKWAAIMVFIEESYDKAVQEKLLLASYTPPTSGPKKSGGAVQLAAKVEEGGDDLGSAGHSNQGDEKKRLEAYRLKVGKCPACKQEHTFKSKWSTTPWPSDRLLVCKKFNDMSSKQRAEQLQKTGGCARCTSWRHTKADCRLPSVDCKEKINGSQCSRDHSRLVCNSGVAYCLAAKSSTDQEYDGIDVHQATLHYMQDIIVNKKDSARSLWDDGSNRVLINNDFARENNLKSREASVTMKVVGDKKKMDVNIYELDLQDMYGKQYPIWGYGIDSIMEPDDPVDLQPVRALFPHVPDEAFSPLPKKRIDILIGLNYNSLHPNGGLGVDAVGNLRALRSRFGSGWVLGGCHKDLKVPPLKFSAQTASARIARVNVVPEVTASDLSLEVTGQVSQFAKVTVDPLLTPDFWECEQLGVLPPRKCPKCKQCAQKGECSEAHYLLTLKEEAELQLISENIKVVDGEVHVQYPFIKHPSCLPNNRGVAVKVASRLWTSLQKDGLLPSYHEEMRKYIDRGTFVKLTKEEMDSYEGPHQYITHHGVLKSSVTTPLRVVTNSSFNNSGNSLNSCLPKGPNSLNDMLGITLRFRCHCCGFMYDLSKAYNTMRTGLVEKHIRRFVWRFSEEEDWQDFGIDRVHFGDVSAACQLEVAKRMISDLGRDIDEQAADIIINDMYVDDGVTGGEEADVARMVGKKDEDGNYDGTLSKILAKGNFVAKEYVIGGDLTQADENLLGNKVFGYQWNAKKDEMSLLFSFNLSKKKRNVRTLPDLNLGDLDSLKTVKMSKRNLLGITNSTGDFLGVASPYTIKLKLNMKKLYEVDIPLAWDDDIPEGLRESWISLIAEALVAEKLIFPRSTRPQHAEGGPRIVVFGDGAFAAFAAVVYLVWTYFCESCQPCEGHFSSRVLCAKARVTPLRGYTIPRSELCGAVLASRLVLAVAIALSKLKNKPTSCIILLDSMCTISSLEEHARKLKPFFHNRRGEILENMEQVSNYCPIEEVHHVSGKLNPADIATRADTKLEDIGPDSWWQTGPSFLCSPRDRWPVTREFVRVEIPDEERRHSGEAVTAAFRAVVILTSDSDIVAALPIKHKTITELLSQNNSLESRKRVLSLVLRCWVSGKSSVTVDSPPSAQELFQAERIILVHAMFATAEAFYAGKLTSLLPFRHGAVFSTRGRLGEKSLESLLGVSSLPILMPSTRTAELFMWRAHLGYSGLFHRSVAATLAKSRSSVWIVRGKDLAKRICRQCMTCRRIRKQLASQQMALVRDESLQPCPPWTFISLDFAGPVIIKGEVNSRSRGKSWILVYVCRTTKSVCMLATSGYSTADFLCKHEEFVARNNRPRSIVSDRGSQLVRAGMVLAEKEKPANWKWEQVIRNNSATSWEFVPVGSQHRNGLSEAQVKILKKSLHLAITPGTILKYSELVTLLAKISHSVNSRPIGLSSTSQDSQQEDFLQPITPNQLLLGRTDDEAQPLEYDESDKLTARLAYVSGVYEAWWRAWYKQVLPSLVPYKKWRKECQNLEVGDVVFMYYPSSIKDDYRLARIVETFPDGKGLVRSVRVCYRKRSKNEKKSEYKSKPLTEEIVAVQRLSLLLPFSEQGDSPSTFSTAPPATSQCSTSSPRSTPPACSTPDSDLQ